MPTLCDSPTQKKNGGPNEEVSGSDTPAGRGGR